MSSQEVLDEAPSRETATEHLEGKRAELVEAEAELSRAEKAMDVDATIAARQRIAVIKDFIAMLETRAAEEREAQAKSDAQKRAVGISRAVGSVVASIEADEQKVTEAAQAYVAAVEQLNGRYRQYETLVAEDAALRDRFGIEGAKIRRVVPPNEREQVVAAVRTIDAVPYATAHARQPAVEECEHGIRKRRTYAEVAGTEGSRIIQSVGLKAFRDLTDRERRAIESLDREKQANASKSAELAVETSIVKHPLYYGPGSVHRG